MSEKCRDGSDSFSTYRRGTCRRHGGVDTSPGMAHGTALLREPEVLQRVMGFIVK